MSEQYKPGDVVKGQVLTQSGQWVPVRTLYSQGPAGTPAVGGPSLGRKWAMGFVWIVLAGWLGMGTVFGVLVGVIGFAVGGLPQGAVYLSGLFGLAVGAWWYVSWLAKAQERTRR